MKSKPFCKPTDTCSRPRNNSRTSLCLFTTSNRWLILSSVTGLLLLSSCHRQSPPSENLMPSPSGPQDPDLQVAAVGYHGRSFDGPVYVPRSSPLEDGTTAYAVTYQKGVTVVLKEDALRHLVSIHPDGSYVFDTGARQIANLKTGSIVLISGLALRSVLSVQTTAEGYLLKTGTAKITDAIKDGRLEGTYHIDFSRMQPSKASSRFLLPGTVHAAGGEVISTLGIAEFEAVFSGYQYQVRFTPGNDRINVQATIKNRSSQGALAYEGVGYVSNFVSTIRIVIKDGKLINLDFINANLAGQLHLKWYAVTTGNINAGSMARITSWPAVLLKNPVLSRAAYHVPIVVGAVPFDLRISLGFSFIPSFTSKNSVVEGNKLIRYNGTGGFRLAGEQTRPFGSLNVQADITTHDTRVVAAGPVGFTAATEAPRLELTLGWPPATLPAAGYLNFVASYGIVTNGMANSSPCQTNVMAFSVNAGAASLSANTFADWQGQATGPSPSLSLWSRTLKSAGATGPVCPG